MLTNGTAIYSQWVAATEADYEEMHELLIGMANSVMRIPLGSVGDTPTFHTPTVSDRAVKSINAYVDSDRIQYIIIEGGYFPEAIR